MRHRVEPEDTSAAGKEREHGVTFGIEGANTQTSEGTISIEEAKRAAEGALSRVALLHVAFSRVLIEEFGRERALDLIAKAMIEYGTRITGRAQKGLPDLAALGLQDMSREIEAGEIYVKGCTLAKVFKEEDALDVKEVLDALAVSAVFNPNATECINVLPDLQGCDMHSTHLVGQGCERALKELGLILTTDARIPLISSR